MFLDFDIIAFNKIFYELKKKYGLRTAKEWLALAKEAKEAMEGMLEPIVKEEMTATVEVRQVFHISKVGYIAGAYVMDGKVKRSDKARLIRDGIVIFTGNIAALKRFKDDVKEVTTNFECGISLQGCNDIKEGDIIETFQEVEIKQKLK